MKEHRFFLLALFLAVSAWGCESSNTEIQADAGKDGLVLDGAGDVDADGDGLQDGRDGDDGDDGDGGTSDAGGGDSLPVQFWGECPFPYTALPSHPLTDELGQEYSVPEIHVRCLVDFDDMQGQVLVKAHPTAVDIVNFDYAAHAAYFCRDGRVWELAEGDYFFEMHHHRWMDMEFVAEDRRFVFGWSEVCKGARPCTPNFDEFDVRRASDAELLAESVPTICAEVGPNGVPKPLVPQKRIPSHGDYLDFSMGSENGDADEAPIHTFTMRTVRMDEREATWEDLSWFLNDQGNQCGDDPCIPSEYLEGRLEWADGRWTPVPGTEDLPAVGISWYGADAYCAWRRMRLPYESDWEMAASSVGQRVFPWGDEVPGCDRVAFSACTLNEASPVCSHSAGNSADGVCDLAGNVAEWMALDYREDFYLLCCDAYTCPGDEDWVGTEKNVRGGGYLSPVFELRAADRQRELPDRGRVDLGLRCVSNNPTSWAPCEDDVTRPNPDRSSCLE